MGTIQDKLNYLNTTKGLIKQAIIDKGQTIADTDTFRSYANKISGIKSGSELNVFVQDTEPETKDGIWIKASNKTVEKIITDENVYASETWGELDNTLPAAVSGDKAVSIGTNIYIFGIGTNGNETYKYDTRNNIYTKLADVPEGYSTNYPTVVGNNVFFFKRGFFDVFKYDTLNDTFSRGEKLTSSTVAYGSIVKAIDNYIYIFGDGLKRYDTLTGTTTSLLSVPYNCAYGAGAVVGTDIYLFGGGTKDAYKYDTLKNTYTDLFNNPFSNCENARAIAINTSIYIFGGNETKSLCCKYDIISDGYTKLENIPYEVSDVSIALVENVIYLLGGSAGSGNRKSKVTFTAIEKEYDNNTVVIAVGINKYNTNLINSDNQKVKNFFYDAWFNSENGLEKNNPTYYGDGTQWICFKNDPTEEVTE